MKKILSFLLGVVFLSSIVLAETPSSDGSQWVLSVSQPVIEGRIVGATTVGQGTNVTVGSARITARSAPSFAGRSKWYFTYWDTANPSQIRQINSVPAQRQTGVSVWSGEPTLEPATETCPKNRPLDCILIVNNYQLQNLSCGKNYQIRFHVDSLDTNQKTFSAPASFSTPDCSQQGTLTLGGSGGITKISDETAKIKSVVDISGFTGTQTVTFSIAYAPTEDFDSNNLEFISLGSIQGEGTVTLDKEIPDQFLCDTPYKYVLKAKINTTEATTPTQGMIAQTDCSPSTTTGNGDGGEEVGNNTYTFLTPLPLDEGLRLQESVEIGAGGGGILGVLQRIFTIMLVAAVVLAVVFMIIGGTRYATGDTLSLKMGGRQIITNAVSGLLFALLAWLLLNIINPDLLRFTLSIPNIGKELTPGGSSGTATSTTGGGTVIPGEGCGPDISDEECFERITADEPSKRAALGNAGISINKAACPRFDASGCTNVGLLSQTTLNKLIQLKRDCNCNITVTGGTEYWLHGSGGNHKKFIAVDLDISNNTLNSFIRSKTSRGSSSVCNGRFEYNGLLFCDENIAGNAPHWHVDTVTSSGSTGPGNTGNPKLFTFPRINIQGYVVPGTGVVYTESQMAARLNSQSMRDLSSQIRQTANREGVDYKLFYALIAQESEGNSQPGSRAGACGVAQLLPSTAQLLDPSLTGDVCQKLKNDINLSLRLGAKYLKQGSGSNIDKLARYNGGPAALESSNDCPGRKKYECPWDVPGYYDRSKPNGAPLKSLEKQSDINTGYSETRFYIINILNMVDAQK